jgi:AcrR family transcriptional regulator
MGDRVRYHHGNLRAELIDASFDLLAAHGLADFSVAKAARAVGVSTASPYRHFADRDHLLAAVAAQAALELAARMRADADAAGTDPRERFAVTAGTYVRYVAERGAGLDVIFSTPLTSLHEEELTDAGRALIRLLLELAEAAQPDASTEDGLSLLERHLVTAHGYVALLTNGFFASRRPRDTPETVAARAVEASRELVGG